MKKNLVKKASVLAVFLLLMGSLTGCSTSAVTNAKLYTSNMKRILFSGSSSSGSSSSETASSESSAAVSSVEAPAEFTIDGETYSFTAVEGASQYLLCLCEPGSTDDSDDYLYSGVISDDGSESYSGKVSDVLSHAYGSYTAKVFALNSSYSMSAGVTADYSVSGELPAPEIACSWDGEGTLSLQVANSDAYDSTATPDSIAVTISGSDGDQAAEFDSSLDDVSVEGLSEGDYTISAVAECSSEYVTNSTAEGAVVEVALAGEALASDDYVEAQQGGDFGGGGGMDEGWDVTPEDVSFEEGAESFDFVIGDTDFFNTTANLQETPDDGAAYTYVLVSGDEGAPFESTMLLQLYEDGSCMVSVTAAGPINATQIYGAWTSDGGMISVTW